MSELETSKRPRPDSPTEGQRQQPQQPQPPQPPQSSTNPQGQTSQPGPQPPRPPPPFPPGGMPPPPQPFLLGLPPMGPGGMPMLPPHLMGMRGMAPAHMPYLTAPVVTTPVLKFKPAPPAKTPPCMEPNNTIYVTNLDEKAKLPVLKEGLKELYSKFGEVLDVVAQHNYRMKGQAFIVFKELSSAQKAVEETNGKPFLKRALAVQFSKNRSDKVAELEGKLSINRQERHERMLKRLEDRRPTAPVKPKNRNNGQASTSSHRHVPEHMLLNKILFLQNLPAEVTEDMLNQVFKQYSGFREVRLVPGRSDLAFVEYETEVQAAMAKTTLNNYHVIPGQPIKITFAKR